MTETTERWLPVVGYEGYYEVSDHGRVRSVDRRVRFADGRSKLARGRVLKNTLHPRYRRFYANLWRDNASKNVPVSRLVLTAFRGPASDGADNACHNNGIATDDRLTNLRWDTQSANLFDAVHHGTHAQARKTHCPRRHPLAGANVVLRRDRPGHRQCKACNRAAADMRYAKRTGRGYDFLAWADEHYARIVDEEAA